MGLEFLARVRHATLWVAALAFVTGVTYHGFAHGTALAAGALWSLANLFLIERMVVAITGVDRRSMPSVRAAALSGAGMLALFALGAALLLHLPPASLLVGFGFPFAVMFLKALSAVLVGTAAWRRFTASRWQVAAVLVLAVGALWFVTSRVGAAPPADPHAAGAAAGTAGHGDAAGHGEAGAHGEAGGHGEHKADGPVEFPNFITAFTGHHPEPGTWQAALFRVEPIIFSLLTALVIGSLLAFGARRRDLIPGRAQNAVEAVVEALHDFIVGVLGEKHGPRYVPFLGSLFLYILAMNWFGFVPFMKAATASINVTAGLALTVFLYVQYTGIRSLGLGGYLGHMIGSPRSAIEWGLAPLMLPIHIIGELAKPLSLACRLFGNIFGEDMLLVGFTSLGIMALGFMHSPIGIPFQLPFLFFALLTSTLQALVFTTLSTVYFLLMLPHDDHGHEEGGHAAHAGAH
jgi:F-type H+-transporting ATPase subunit a